MFKFYMPCNNFGLMPLHKEVLKPDVFYYLKKYNRSGQEVREASWTTSPDSKIAQAQNNEQGNRGTSAGLNMSTNPKTG